MNIISLAIFFLQNFHECMYYCLASCPWILTEKPVHYIQSVKVLVPYILVPYIRACAVYSFRFVLWNFFFKSWLKLTYLGTAASNRKTKKWVSDSDQKSKKITFYTIKWHFKKVDNWMVKVDISCTEASNQKNGCRIRIQRVEKHI